MIRNFDFVPHPRVVSLIIWIAKEEMPPLSNHYLRSCSVFQNATTGNYTLADVNVDLHCRDEDESKIQHEANPTAN
jgi:hypothetical protein